MACEKKKHIMCEAVKEKKNTFLWISANIVIVGEPKSRMVQKHKYVAPERYTAGILYTDGLNSA